MPLQPVLAYNQILPSDCRTIWVQVESAEKHPSGAKALGFQSTIFGTADAVPFLNTNFTSGCESG
jgi:hypothetical protein